jgi:RNA polymerase sigma-70 factor (ECF subfamily)
VRAAGVIDPAAAFTEHRDLLFTVAYEMLGVSADAEDVVQEAWLRWADVDHADVRDARAYLVRVVTRLALNRLRTVKRQRETYVGPWLPEPLLTTDDVADDVELAESVSVAMLVVLESLSPAERAVFVLRDVFGFEHDEIAEAVGKSNAAVRQIAHRAREHVRARRPRASVSQHEHAAVSERFFQAAAGGDLQGLMDVLAPDVVLLSDGGGRAKAALRPITGSDKVVRFLEGVRPPAERLRYELAWVNGRRSVLFYVDDALDTVVTSHVEDGRIREIYIVRNPDKLGKLRQAAALVR